MGYTKKTVDPQYKTWQDIILSCKGMNPTLSSYSAIAGKVNSLDWEGEGKKAICGTIANLDASCKQLYSEISKNIEKVHICNGELLSSIELLIAKHEEYNGLVDEYYSILAEIERLKNEKKA